MFGLTELSGSRHTAWLGGGGGSERVCEALAGEKAAGMSHLGVSGQSHHRMAWDCMEFQRQLS